MRSLNLFSPFRLPVPPALQRLEGPLQAGSHEGLALPTTLPRPRNRFHPRQRIKHRRHLMSRRRRSTSLR